MATFTSGGDLLMSDGNDISGSSTSTGSFGNVQVSSRLILPSVNNNAAPTLAFGDGNTGFYETSDNTLSVAIARK